MRIFLLLEQFVVVCGQGAGGLVLVVRVVAHHFDDGAERGFVVPDEERVGAVFAREGAEGEVREVELVFESGDARGGVRFLGGGGRGGGGGAGLLVVEISDATPRSRED